MEALTEYLKVVFFLEKLKLSMFLYSVITIVIILLFVDEIRKGKKGKTLRLPAFVLVIIGIIFSATGYVYLSKKKEVPVPARINICCEEYDKVKKECRKYVPIPWVVRLSFKTDVERPYKIQCTAFVINLKSNIVSPKERLPGIPVQCINSGKEVVLNLPLREIVENYGQIIKERRYIRIGLVLEYGDNRGNKKQKFLKEVHVWKKDFCESENGRP